MNQELKMAVAAHYPELKAYQIEKAVSKYEEIMLRAISNSILSWGFTDDQISLPLDEVRREIDRVKLNGKAEYILTLLHRSPYTRLVHEDLKGNIGRNTRVSLNPIYQDYIMEQLIDLNKEMAPKRLRELASKANMRIEVDPQSLASYVTQTRRDFRNSQNKSKEYRDALAHNLLVAEQLVHMVEEQEGVSYLNEYWQEHDSGRVYGQGLSLQCISKNVRHAALGHCHKYDFKASSYALMTGLALSINPELKVADITDYIKNRSSIRKRIATDVAISEEWCKAIFTSLGFGASTVNNPYTSIRGKLGQVKYDKLMANREFRYIAERMDEVRATVADHYSGDDFEIAGKQYQPIDPNSDPMKPKKRNINQKLAWIYQAMESHAAEMFALMAAEEGHVAVLPTHDCLYFKNPVPQLLLDDIHYALSQTYPLLKFEHEAIWPIQAEEDFGRHFREQDEWEAKHRAHIEAEERKAGPAYTPHELDMESGYFADAIAALNPDMKRGLGQTFNPMDRFQ
jgi:hypothetical protein